MPFPNILSAIRASTKIILDLSNYSHFYFLANCTVKLPLFELSVIVLVLSDFVDFEYPLPLTQERSEWVKFAWHNFPEISSVTAHTTFLKSFCFVATK